VAVDLTGSINSMLEGSRDYKDPIKVEVVNIDTNNTKLKDNPLSMRKQKSSIKRGARNS
jgi:hypothetical protein